MKRYTTIAALLVLAVALLGCSGERTVSFSPMGLFHHLNPFRQAQPDKHGLTMGVYTGTTTTPLLLVSSTHNAKTDFLEEGLVKNVASQPVQSYRIGWLVLLRNGDPPIYKEGPLISPDRSIQPQEVLTVPPQHLLPKDYADPNYRMILFFVVEATLEDGTEWREDVDAIEKKHTIQ